MSHLAIFDVFIHVEYTCVAVELTSHSASIREGQISDLAF